MMLFQLKIKVYNKLKSAAEKLNHFYYHSHYITPAGAASTCTLLSGKDGTYFACL